MASINTDVHVIESGDEYNTLSKIADKHGLNVEVLIKLNPNIYQYIELAEGRTITVYKSTSEMCYTVGVNAIYRNIHDIAEYFNKPGNPYGVPTNAGKIRDLNPGIVTEDFIKNGVIPTGIAVLYSVESLTDTKDSFNTEVHPVAEGYSKLSMIATDKSVDVGTLVSLNPNLSQSEELYPGTNVLVKVISAKVATNGKTVTITPVGLMPGTSRQLYVKWDWELENTEHYEVVWEYYVSEVGLWFEGSKSTTSDGETKESIWNAPDNADAARVKVKPVAKGGSYTGTSTTKWEAEWSKYRTYDFSEGVPELQGSLSVTIEKYKLTARVDNLDYSEYRDGLDATVEFEIVQDDTKVYKKGWARIATGTSIFSTTIETGHTYKVRYRVETTQENYTEWSGHSSIVSSLPATPVIHKVSVNSESSITLAWDKVNTATGYTVQYVQVDESISATKEEYFNLLGVDIPSASFSADETSTNKQGYLTKTIEGLTPGFKYYIRMCASNDSSDISGWSNIETFMIGTEPVAPTTWSSTTSAVVGETLKLYWIHNSEDGSKQTGFGLELIINGNPHRYNKIADGYSDNLVVISKNDPDDDDDRTYVCVINPDADELVDGATINWRVQTGGAKYDGQGYPVFGPYSVQRTVKVYAPPTLSVNVLDYLGNDVTEIGLGTFPFTITMRAGNMTNQIPTGYYITITANTSYETVDEVGNSKSVIAGSKVFSKYYDESAGYIEVELSANDIDLHNNIGYTITCTVSASSGLTGTDSTIILVGWEEQVYTPYAEIGIDPTSVAAYIRPFSDGGDDVLYSVYRREFDGTFTEIETENPKNTFVVDPHPALDYARYRIVARDPNTGAVSFNDVPGHPILEKSVIIQWDESWISYDVTNDDGTINGDLITSQPAYAGSMLKIPYNIDVSNAHTPDVSLIKYIGRKRPVSYYGTQLGESATWNFVFPKSDKATLYALRKLAIWMGDVYVREPSGSGYWANISVSFSQKHLDLTIPVTLNITRVEGGK